MVFELFRAKERPPICVVEPMPNGDFVIQCDVTKETVRRLIDKERVCVIEFDVKSGNPISYCGTGKDVVSRIFL